MRKIPKQDDIKYFYKRLDQQDIINKVPKGDYIAVFGTSHTYGLCDRGEDGRDGDLLDEDGMWVFSLGKKLGIEVFNVSMPGNYNINMVRQMTDFFELPKEVISRCKLIIAEPRVGDTAGIMCTDVIEELDVSVKELNQVLTNSYAFNVLNKKQYIWETNVYAQFTNPASQNMTTEDYARRLIGNVGHYEDDIPPPSVLKNVTNYIDHHTRTSAISISSLLRDYENIRTMKQFASMANIPFMWFCFDSQNILDDEEVALWEKIYTETSTLFDARISKLELGVVDEYELRFGEDALYGEQCNCGHFSEVVNNWVSNMVHKQIIELGYEL